MLEIGEMHGATTTAANTRRPTEALSHKNADVGPLGNAVTVTAMRRDYEILVLKCSAGTDGNRFLAY
jgi:hypothetical protein